MTETDGDTDTVRERKAKRLTQRYYDKHGDVEIASLAGQLSNHCTHSSLSDLVGAINKAITDLNIDKHE